MKKILLFSLLLMLLALFMGAPISWAYNNLPWSQWVNQLREEALAQGVSAQLFDEVFTGLTPDPRVIRFDHTQPERRITFLHYRRTRIDPFRISLGVQEFRKNRRLLENIGQHYGVDPCFIAAFWGIETSYGRYMGNFSVVRSLATLAYDDRRSENFRMELLIALHILNEGHVRNENFKGEWAGASGYPQFLPSSWKKYAVDYDHDGRKDIWNDKADAFASIANYLVQHGWQTDEPWGIMVQLPDNFSQNLAGLKTQKTVAEWLALGVKPAYGELEPNANLKASILIFEGGPNFMVFHNFSVLLKYNNSNFYAASVGYLADSICKKKGREEDTEEFN